MKDLTFRVGLANMRNNIPHLARLIEKGRLDPTPLVSHVLPLATPLAAIRFSTPRAKAR